MWIIVSDLHLTDAPRDSYRNGIFDFIAAAARQHRATDIFLLGDITDRKDNHSGAFIAALTERFVGLLTSCDAHVRVLQGNHDYSDPDFPTLGFLPHIDERLSWYGRPRESFNTVAKDSSGRPIIMMPFARYESDFEAAVRRIPDDEYAAAFFHQTFTGAKTSSGMSMGGIPVELARRINAKRYFAGDIHVPQRIDCIEYVGSPYQIRFGDDYEGRVIVYDPDKDDMQSLRYPTIAKRTLRISDPDELRAADINEGDQVKIRMSMSREKFSDWKSIEAEIVSAVKAKGATLHGVEISETEGAMNAAPEAESRDPNQIFNDFCAANNVGDNLKKFGAEYLE